MNDRVDQRDNEAEIIAGRDVIFHGSGGTTPLSELVERYRAEVEEDRDLQQFIEELQLYLEPATEQPVGLATKLEQADRADQFHLASRLKENFYKKLLRHQLSPAAQDIFAHILGFLHTRFEANIVPLIVEGTDREAIDAAVASEVLEAAYALISDNVLLIHLQDLRGMLYYLTGNCHIRWAY